MGNIISILSLIISSASIITILVFILKLINYMAKKIKIDTQNIKLDEFMSRLDNLVKTSVISTNQIIVSPLKEANSFAQIDKEEAFVSCKEKILNSINESDIKLLEPNLINLDEWISTRIEYYVKLNK